MPTQVTDALIASSGVEADRVKKLALASIKLTGEPDFTNIPADKLDAYIVAAAVYLIEHEHIPLAKTSPVELDDWSIPMGQLMGALSRLFKGAERAHDDYITYDHLDEIRKKVVRSTYRMYNLDEKFLDRIQAEKIHADLEVYIPS